MKKTLILIASLACALAFTSAHAVECDPVPLKNEAYTVATLDGKTIKMEPRSEKQLAARAERLADGRVVLKAADPAPYLLSGVRYSNHAALAAALKENIKAEQACQVAVPKRDS